MTICTREFATPAELALGRDPKVGSSKSEFLSGMNEQGEKKVRVRSANLLGKIDIGLPETMLPAMFVFLKPCYLQCLSQQIRVTQAN